MTSITLSWEANYDWSTGTADGWYATISANFSPSNATTQEFTWSIAKNGSYLNTMSIKSKTSLICVIKKDVWYGGQCVLSATSVDGVVAYLYCKCGSLNETNNKWTFTKVSTPEFPK